MICASTRNGMQSMSDTATAAHKKLSAEIESLMTTLRGYSREQHRAAIDGLMSLQDIALYAGVSYRTIISIKKSPSFPRAIRVRLVDQQKNGEPTLTSARYQRREIVEWFDRQKIS